jgi:hypothetical protein
VGTWSVIISENSSRNSILDHSEFASIGDDLSLNSDRDEQSHPNSSGSSSAEDDDMGSIIFSEYDEKNDSELIIEKESSANSTFFGITGLLRYTWSHMFMLISVDVFVMSTIDAYVLRCQKSERSESMRQRRANARWGFEATQQTIERFRVQRQRRSSGSWNQYLQFFQQYETAARQAGEEFAKKWFRVANESDETKLPPYYRLCFLVQEEMYTSIRIVYTLRPLAAPLSYFLAFSGLGHGLTAVGWKYWMIALRKYSLFAGACLGIWMDETYEAYEIEDLVRAFTISSPDEATVQFIPLTIASRVILLQALGPTTTLISIIVINVCVAPLFVFSPKLRERIPPLLHLNPRKVAVNRERAELLGRRKVGMDQLEQAIHMEEWVIMTRSVSILLSESRLMVFLFNLVSLSLTIMILEGIDISTGTLALLLTGMLPYYVGSTLIPILYIGKRLNLKDEDFRVVFLGWWPAVYDLLLWLSGFPQPQPVVHTTIVQAQGGGRVEQNIIPPKEDSDYGSISSMDGSELEDRRIEIEIHVSEDDSVADYWRTRRANSDEYLSSADVSEEGSD